MCLRRAASWLGSVLVVIKALCADWSVVCLFTSSSASFLLGLVSGLHVEEKGMRPVG